jgi:hypothetical protein
MIVSNVGTRGRVKFYPQVDKQYNRHQSTTEILQSDSISEDGEEEDEPNQDLQSPDPKHPREVLFAYRCATAVAILLVTDDCEEVRREKPVHEEERSWCQEHRNEHCDQCKHDNHDKL